VAPAAVPIVDEDHHENRRTARG